MRGWKFAMAVIETIAGLIDSHCSVFRRWGKVSENSIKLSGKQSVVHPFNGKILINLCVQANTILFQGMAVDILLGNVI